MPPRLRLPPHLPSPPKPQKPPRHIIISGIRSFHGVPEFIAGKGIFGFSPCGAYLDPPPRSPVSGSLLNKPCFFPLAQVPRRDVPRFSSPLLLLYHNLPFRASFFLFFACLKPAPPFTGAFRRALPLPGACPSLVRCGVKNLPFVSCTVMCWGRLCRRRSCAGLPGGPCQFFGTFPPFRFSGTQSLVFPYVVKERSRPENL